MEPDDIFSSNHKTVSDKSYFLTFNVYKVLVRVRVQGQLSQQRFFHRKAACVKRTESRLKIGAFRPLRPRNLSLLGYLCVRFKHFGESKLHRTRSCAQKLSLLENDFRNVSRDYFEKNRDNFSSEWFSRFRVCIRSNPTCCKKLLRVRRNAHTENI